MSAGIAMTAPGLTEVRNRRVLVLGLGLSGQAAAELLLERGARVTVEDDRSVPVQKRDIMDLLSASYCHGYGFRDEIPSFFIRERSVLGLIPSRSATPPGPAILPFKSDKVSFIYAASTSARV